MQGIINREQAIVDAIDEARRGDDIFALLRYSRAQSAVIFGDEIVAQDWDQARLERRVRRMIAEISDALDDAGIGTSECVVYDDLPADEWLAGVDIEYEIGFSEATR